MRYTPGSLARLLRTAAPSAQQAEVISAPVEPLLVIAGAGSGKTETMAARVVWLVANGHVRPDQVLGLTFTRKAAGELGIRVRNRLSQLVRRLGREELLAGEPTVATYHSYAARIVREHGIRVGYEPTARLLSEAVAWQLADAVVRAYDGDMSAVTSAPSTVTEAVLRLSADLAEHLKTSADLAAWTGRFFAEVQGKPGRMTKQVRDVLAKQRARLQLLPLVRAYDERKQALEAFDFGDQVARAVEIARASAEACQIERDRYRVVLLDEYQDTSHAQAVLLTTLFGGGHPVTAVGDPCQSIYGWRGASAGTLERFPGEFPRRGGVPAQTRSLTTSWRNRPEVLDVANALSRQLREGGLPVAELTAAPADVLAQGGGSGHRAGSGHGVVCALLETSLAEAGWIARRVLAAWQIAAKAGEETPACDLPAEHVPTTAVLVRTRAQVPAIVGALRAVGLPVEAVGLGGLLGTPEIRDLVSVLRVLADPAEGAALLRILTGPRWRIGPRDLVALHRRARDLASARARPGESEELLPGISVEPLLTNRLDEAVLIEALDDLGEPSRYSEEGHRRFAALARELRGLRARLRQPLPDLIADIEQTIGLSVEVAARSGTAEDPGLARGHLDAFSAVAARFCEQVEGASLKGFLAYLAAAEETERGLAPGEVDVVEGAVQVLTIHAAKGLEWDVVAVAGLATGVFPTRGNAGDHWLRGLGVLPFELRGDAQGLPRLDLDDAANQKDVVRGIEAFGAAWREHDLAEERRLAYVAVTRPRRLLLASGHWWGEGTKGRRGPSPFLVEIRARCLAGAGTVEVWTPDPGSDAENPVAAIGSRAIWPADPLGPRRPAMDEAAAAVREAAAAVREAAATVRAEAVTESLVSASPEFDDPIAASWADEARLLLAERQAATTSPDAPVEVELPSRLSVSQLVLLRQEPAKLARQVRRPMPAPLSEAARRGTAFHRWLETRHLTDHLLDLDELPGAADSAGQFSDQDDLAELLVRFEASEWADREPLDVEVPFSMVIGGVVIRGRLDAVYACAPTPAGEPCYEIVDWKTGTVPTGRAAAAAQVQLAAYRLALAALRGIPVERVSAAFFYVRDGVTIRPPADPAALPALITQLGHQPG